MSPGPKVYPTRPASEHEISLRDSKPDERGGLLRKGGREGGMEGGMEGGEAAESSSAHWPAKAPASRFEPTDQLPSRISG